MAILEAKQLSRTFGARLVVNNVDMQLDEGSMVAIAGATGSGKSSLLKMLAGLLQPDEGQVRYRGSLVEGPDTKLIPGHPRIAYLSQHFELRNNYRVEEIFDYSTKITEDKAEEIFNLCDVAHLMRRRTDELSGGERQRVALARVLVTGPDILLLDEPFSNLDFNQKMAVRNVVQKIAATFRLTVALVSHDPADILSFASVVHVMQAGRIVQSASPEDIYYRAKDEYVAGLFGPFTPLTPSLRFLFQENQQSLASDISLLRPEMLSIALPHEGALTGVVKSNAFLGPYYQAEIVLGDHLLIVNHADLLLRPGASVSIHVKPPLVPFV